MMQQLRHRERSDAERLKLSRTCDVEEKEAGSWSSCMSPLEIAHGPVATKDLTSLLRLEDRASRMMLDLSAPVSRPKHELSSDAKDATSSFR